MSTTVVVEVLPENLAIFGEMFPNHTRTQIIAQVQSMPKPSPRLEFQMEHLLATLSIDTPALSKTPITVEAPKKKPMPVKAKPDSESDEPKLKAKKKAKSVIAMPIVERKLIPWQTSEEAKTGSMAWSSSLELKFGSLDAELEESDDDSDEGDPFLDMTVDEEKLEREREERKKNSLRGFVKQMISDSRMKIEAGATRSLTRAEMIQAKRDKIGNQTLSGKIRCKTHNAGTVSVHYIAAYEVLEHTGMRKSCVSTWRRDDGTMDYITDEKFAPLTVVNQSRSIVHPFELEMMFCFPKEMFKADLLLGNKANKCADTGEVQTLTKYDLNTFCSVQRLTFLHQVRACHEDIFSSWMPVTVDSLVHSRVLLGSDYSAKSSTPVCMCGQHTELAKMFETLMKQEVDAAIVTRPVDEKSPVLVLSEAEKLRKALKGNAAPMIPFVPYAGSIVAAKESGNRMMIKFRMHVGLHSNLMTRKKNQMNLMYRLLGIYHGFKLYKSVPAKFQLQVPLHQDQKILPPRLESYHHQAMRHGFETADDDVRVVDLMQYGRENYLMKNLQYDGLDFSNLKRLSEQTGIESARSGIVLLPYQSEIFRYMLFQESQPYSLSEQLFLVGKPFDPLMCSTSPVDFKWNIGLKNGYDCKVEAPFRLKTNFNVPIAYRSEEDKKFVFDSSTAGAAAGSDYEGDSEDEETDPTTVMSSKELRELKMLEEDPEYKDSKAKYINPVPEADRLKRKGGVIAAEMRLGKTIMTLSLISYQHKLAKERGEKKPNATIIIAPLNVIQKSWLKACKDLVPHLKVLLLTNPANRTKYRSDAEALKKAQFDIVLCSYSNLGTFDTNSPILKYPYKRASLDEVHMVPKSDTHTFAALCEITCENVWFLTGSPFTSKLGVGTLGPILNSFFGKTISNQAFLRMTNMKSYNYMFKLYKRMIQLGMIVLSSTQKEVMDQTAKRNQKAKMHWIRTSDHEAFVKYYNSIIDCAPVKNFAKEALSLEDSRYFDRLRESCSSYLDIASLVQEKMMKKSAKTGASVRSLAEDAMRDREEKTSIDPVTGKKSGTFVVLKGDSTDKSAFGFDKEDDCPACMDGFDSPFQLPCGHVMCKNCLINIIDTVKSDSVLKKGVGGSADLKCPLCNHKAREGELSKVIWDHPEDVKPVIWQSEYEQIMKSIRDGSKTSLGKITGLTEDNHPKVAYCVKDVEAMFRMALKHEATIMPTFDTPELDTDEAVEEKKEEAVGKKRKAAPAAKGEKKRKTAPLAKATETTEVAIEEDDGGDRVDDTESVESYVSPSSDTDSNHVRKLIIFTAFRTTQQALCMQFDKSPILSSIYVNFNNQFPIQRKGKILEDFCDPKSPYRILIMPMKAGSVGLDLSVCNRIIFMEPFCDRAAEEQSMNRCYNIARHQEITIDYYCLKDTIEETIVEQLNTAIAMSSTVEVDGKSFKTVAPATLAKKMKSPASATADDKVKSFLMENNKESQMRNKKTMQTILTAELHGRRFKGMSTEATSVVDYSLRAGV